MKIVLMEPLGVAHDIIENLADKLRNDGHTFTAYDSFTTDTDELIRRADDADILMIANHPLPGQVIRTDGNLKFISVAFVGIDHIDTEACKEKNIGISNTGGYCDDAVAELAEEASIAVVDSTRHGTEVADVVVKRVAVDMVDGVAGGDLAFEGQVLKAGKVHIPIMLAKAEIPCGIHFVLLIRTKPKLNLSIGGKDIVGLGM